MCFLDARDLHQLVLHRFVPPVTTQPMLLNIHAHSSRETVIPGQLPSVAQDRIPAPRRSPDAPPTLTGSRTTRQSSTAFLFTLFSLFSLFVLFILRTRQFRPALQSYLITSSR